MPLPRKFHNQGCHIANIPTIVQCSFWTNFDNSGHSGRDATAAMHVALLLRIERGIFVNVHRTAYRAAGKKWGHGNWTQPIFQSPET